MGHEGSGGGDTRFVVSGPHVIAEAFDDEVIVVDLERGHYHSLRGCAPLIWRGISDGRTLGEITDAVHGRVTGSPDARSMVTGFVGRLEAAGLVTSTNGGGGAVDGPLEPPAGLEPPTLETFTDMEDLLLLDPLHDVDGDAGWPHPVTG